MNTDRHRIAQILQEHESVLFITLTLPPQIHPAHAQRLLGKVWSSTFDRGSWWASFRERHGITARIRVTEWAFPIHSAGASAHIHLLIAGDHRLTVEAGNAIALRWATKAVGEGLDAQLSAQDARQVPKGDDRERVAQYVTKQSAIREAKPGQARYPGDLLRSVAATGPGDDLDLLTAWHRAVSGKHKISISIRDASDVGS